MRKRINPNAVCSSENYSASKRVHRAMLQKEHGSFSMVALSKIRAEKEEELSFERRMALQKMKKEEDFVYVRVFGKLMQLTKERYLKYHTDWKPLDKDGNEITVK